MHTAQQALQAMDEEATRRPPDNINQISIKVIRCNDVQARREGKGECWYRSLSVYLCLLLAFILGLVMTVKVFDRGQKPS